MFKRRPRGFGLLAIVAGLAATGLIASVALAVVSDSGTYSVIVADKSQSSPLVDIGNASVEYIGSDANNQSSGTGIFDPFVRLQADPTEKGYNTNGTVQFDTKTGQWTHAILASAIPVVDCNGSEPGTDTCWELFVDINDSNTAKYISLTDVEIWFTTNPNLVGYIDPTGFPSGATQEYDFSGEIQIQDVNQGSGRGDLRYLVPTAGHTWTSSTYFVLFSKWGSSTAAPDGKTFSSDGGFEEWKVRKAPNVGVVKTANPVGPVNAGTDIGFDITVSNTGAADATNVTITDPLPAGGGGLNWSLNPAFSGCSITGSVGSQTLNCSFATLAAGASIGPIHIQSPTTATDCAVVSNTATVASGNDGGGSSTASVTVQCAAIMILKQSTKTGNPLVTDPTPANTADNAIFAVDGPDADSTADFSVTDNSASDGDSTYGEVCVAGLAPGTYTISETQAPAGYGSGNPPFDGTALAVSGTNCGANQPATGDRAVFRNPPLGEITVGYHDLGSGETSATSITCAPQGGSNISPQAAADDDDISGYSETQAFTFNPVAPGTYACTVVVDP